MTVVVVQESATLIVTRVLASQLGPGAHARAHPYCTSMTLQYTVLIQYGM